MTATAPSSSRCALLSCGVPKPRPTTVTDFGVPKAIAAVPQLRPAMAAVTDRSLSVQQDILETFVDRGQLRQLAEPTHRPNGRRTPGLTLDHPRQLALMHPLGRFAPIAASDTFTTKELHPVTAAALDLSPDQSRLSSLRDELSKLRAKDSSSAWLTPAGTGCSRRAIGSA